jgi:hypothetical protein
MCKESLILQWLQPHFLDSSFNSIRALPSKPKKIERKDTQKIKKEKSQMGRKKNLNKKNKNKKKKPKYYMKIMS